MDQIRRTIELALGAQYDVLHPIGRGGMGAVYLARERLLERLVAVKVLPHEAAQDSSGRERFLREARTAARLSHANIVPLYSFAEAEGTFLYIMGYVQGESLEARLARDGRIPATEARHVLAQIADALDYAHRQGVVHRDVKPDNILIEEGTGRAVLADFGIAKHGLRGGTLTQTGTVLGTPHYMSPEQAGADDVDGRSDVYALGVVGYRMISGRLPFDGATMREVLMAQIAREPEPLVASDGDGALVTAVMRALRKAPTERWPTARAMADAMRPSDHEMELPEELVNHPSMASKFLFGGFGFNVVVGAMHSFVPGDDLWQLMMAPWAAMVAMIGVGVRQAHRVGMPWRESLRMSFWAPSTWWLWWPARLRRPGDVWRRLPSIIRHARAMYTAAAATFAGVVVPSLVILLARVAGDRPTRGTIFEQGFMDGGIVAGALMIIGMAMTHSWRRRFGVANSISDRLVWEPTWNNARFWNRPDVAPLLGATAPVVTQPRTPQELLHSVVRDVDALPSAMQAAVYGAGDAARELTRLVGQVDRELAELAKHAEPGERERLEQKMAAMPAMENEPAARREMRELMSGQLQLFDRLELRRRQLGDDRDRLLALLHNLWHQVASLRADAERDARGVADITGKVRAICEEAARQQDAYQMVEAMLPAAPTSPQPHSPTKPV